MKNTTELHDTNGISVLNKDFHSKLIAIPNPVYKYVDNLNFFFSLIMNNKDFFKMERELQEKVGLILEKYAQIRRQQEKVTSSLLEALKEGGWEEYEIPNYINIPGIKNIIYKDDVAINVETGFRFNIKKVNICINDIEEITKNGKPNGTFYGDSFKEPSFPLNENVIVPSNINSLDIIIHSCLDFESDMYSNSFYTITIGETKVLLSEI